MEVKQIITYFSTVLSYQSNTLLLKVIPNFCLFPPVGRPFAVITFMILVIAIVVALTRVIQRRRPAAILTCKLSNRSDPAGENDLYRLTE
jgi:predicted membrane protein